MAGDVLILGDVLFGDFAIPSRISLGMGQMLGVQKLIGGQRVIDAMGLDPEPICWSGHWRGPGATANSQAMDAMTAAGQQVSCSWGAYDFQVVIRKYHADYEAAFEIPYHLEIEVLPIDYDTSNAPASVDDAVSSDMATATNAGTLTPVGGPGGGVGGINAGAGSGDTVLAPLQGFGHA